MAEGEPLAALRAAGKLGLARALAALEREPHGAATAALLDQAWQAPAGRVLGLTGPPGVGKSTLISALIARARGQGRRVAVLAVDPSSPRSGGALLGDRTRLALDPEDPDLFVRSLAARDRLGGLAELAFPGVVLLRALFELVIVETVGVGQSETAVRELADTVLLAVQPGSGDALQFMKSGILEIPDIIAVTKADLGAIAERSRRDLEAALKVTGEGGTAIPVLAVSATQGDGLDALLAAIEAQPAPGPGGRAGQARRWLADTLRQELGRRGLARLKGRLERYDGTAPPFGLLAELLDAAG